MRASFTSLAERYGTAVAGAAVLLGCALAAPTFTEGQNLLNVGKDAVYLAILSLGFTLALLVAELDLSVADVASLSAVCTGFLVQQGLPPLVCAGGGLLVGVLAGMLNGAAVTVLRVPSLVATLGTAAIARGLSFGLTGGVAFHQMHRAAAGDSTRLAPGEGPAAAARRAVVRDGQRQSEQGQHATRTAPLRRCPARGRRIVQPERKVTASRWACLMRWPVRDTAAGLRTAAATGGVAPERHGRKAAAHSTQANKPVHAPIPYGSAVEPGEAIG